VLLIKMESKFNLLAAQNRGMASTSHATEFLIGTLIVVVLVATLSGTIFSYLGTGAVGLGNSTANPGVPSWLPATMIIVVAVGLLYLVLRTMGVVKK
jgi:ABC-type multidrug transport system permease subunit